MPSSAPAFCGMLAQPENVRPPQDANRQCQQLVQSNTIWSLNLTRARCFQLMESVHPLRTVVL